MTHDRKVHEYLESKLMEEHGPQDEVERPGITGSKSKVTHDGTIVAAPTAEVPPSTLPSTEVEKKSSRQQSEPSDQTAERLDKKTKVQGGIKRSAEDEADDSERGDRKNWRNYVEPASSSQAPVDKGTKRVA